MQDRAEATAGGQGARSGLSTRVIRPGQGPPPKGGPRETKAGRIAVAIFACVVAVANVALLAYAARDRSWGAFGVAMVSGPISNGVLALAWLLVALALRCTGRERFSGLILWATLIPLVAALFDLAIIFSMDLHGS